MSFSASELEERKNTLGASEIAAVAGILPWRSAHDTWLVKRGLVDELGDVTTRMGNRVEACVREEYCLEMNAEVAHFGTIIHPTEPWASATPDAAVYGARRLLEIKCVGWRMAHHFGTDVDAIPAYYRAQLAWQMECCDADEAHLAAWIGGSDFRIYTVQRDRELGAMLLDVGRRFWFDHVLPGIPPPADGTEGARRMLERLYPTHRTPLKPATPTAQDLAAKLRAAKAEAERAELRVQEFQNKMIEEIGESEGLTADDWKVTLRADKNGKRRFLFKDKTAA